MLWFLFKILIVIVLAVLVRGTLPRFRIDQLLTQFWKIYIFLFIYFLIGLIILVWWF